MDINTKSIQSQIVSFFSQFRQHYAEITQILKESQQIALNLSTLNERLNRIKKANIAQTPLEGLFEIKNNLIHHMIKQINVCYTALHSYQSSANKLYHGLKDKHVNISNACSKIDFKSDNVLVKGGAFQPRLSTVLEFTNDCIAMFLHVTMQIKCATALITEANKQELYNMFLIDEAHQRRIDEILGDTQYCEKFDVTVV